MLDQPGSFSWYRRHDEPVDVTVKEVRTADCDAEVSAADPPEAAAEADTEKYSPANEPEDEDNAPAPLPDAPGLESLYVAEPGPSGWAVPAGEWISHSFSPPLYFTLPVDGTITSDTADAIEIAVGDPAAPDGYLVISTPIAISRPTGPIPIDLVDRDNALAGTEVLYESIGEGPFGEYSERDVVVPDGPPFDQYLSPCYRDPELQCLDPLVTRAGYVLLEAGISHRFVVRDYGDNARLYIVATPTDPDNEEFRSLATQIALSAAPAEGSMPNGPTSITSLGSRIDQVPEGTYVASVGDTTINFVFEETFARVELPILTPSVVGFEDLDDIGQIWIINFTDFIDADTGQARTDRTADAPLPTAQFEADLRSTLSVSDAGRELIGGIEAPWFAATGDPATGDSCASFRWPSTAEATCLIWTTTQRVRWFAASDVVGLIYYLEAEDMLIFITPDPGHTIDEVLDRFEPLLAGMTIQPAS